VVASDEKSGKNLIDEIKQQWKQLWLERIDDKVRAEGMAERAFPLCFVERGTVIVATRDYKPLDLKEILCLNQVQNFEQVMGPPTVVGGWKKFARSVLNNQARSRRFVLDSQQACHTKSLQHKKGGRGWMHRIE
jgi:hypothetical protein